MMKLDSLHLLLTYQCTLECDHCFVWGSPWQTGHMSVSGIVEILRQADELGTVKSIYFEGGEPFLFYATLLEGVRRAVAAGYQVGIVSNSYWAISEEDALVCLEPFTGLVSDMAVSQDTYHWGDEDQHLAENARAACAQLGIPTGVISIAQPATQDAQHHSGQLPQGESAVMFRGRAAERLTSHAVLHPAESFGECPYENLREPGRVHIDPLGFVHICQGISLGNLYQTPLAEICRNYQPESHPITGPLLLAGPSGLAQHYDLPTNGRFADACHLCYETRLALRERFPEILAPESMYGVPA